MSDKFVLDGYGVNRKFVDTGMTDPYGKPVHAEVIAFDGTPGGSTVIPPGGGDPVALPINGTLVDGTPLVIAVASGVLAPGAVWVNPGPGDAVRIRYRVDAAAPWVTLYEGGTYFDDVREGKVQAYEFTRTAGAGTTSKWGIV